MVFFSGCSDQNVSAAANTSMKATDSAVSPTQTATPRPSATSPLPAKNQTENTPTARAQVEVQVYTYISTPEASPTWAAVDTDWKTWPVLPSTTADMKVIYQWGLQKGNDPHAFSILGDCQSLPEVFLGPYDNDPAARAVLSTQLQETARNFSGSFDRYSPTVKDGTTAGALLWAEWNDNKDKLCEPGETSLDCELRVHRPSIVLIHIGTHWEGRNYRYLTLIIERILEHGAVPVLVTKADNRELDERVNQNMAQLALEFDLPVWNFWATVQHLPNDGLYPNSTWELSPEAEEIHRQSALEALDAVWRAVR
jgi:hypothetical protein